MDTEQDPGGLQPPTPKVRRPYTYGIPAPAISSYSGHAEPDENTEPHPVCVPVTQAEREMRTRLRDRQRDALLRRAEQNPEPAADRWARTRRARAQYLTPQPIKHHLNEVGRRRIANRPAIAPRGSRRPNVPRTARTSTRSSAPSDKPAPGDPEAWAAWLALSSDRERCPYCGYPLVRGLCPNATCTGWS